MTWLKFHKHQMLVKQWFDTNYTGNTNLKVGDLTLKWNKLIEPKGKNSKLQHLWLGPFHISKKIGHGTYRLNNF